MDAQDARSLTAAARRRDIGAIVRWQARRTPNKTALVYEGVRDTFAEFDNRIDRVANALLALGVGKGDRVALISHNNRAVAILRFAIIRAGAIATPINFMLGRPRSPTSSTTARRGS